MNIWKVKPEIKSLNEMSQNTMLSHLGVEFIAIGEDFLKATMPVDHRTHQPMGLLHGGASAALAETLGSFASHLVVDSTRFDCVGLEINANHIRPKTEGMVTGTAKPIHLGSKTHIWEIRIEDERGKLICVSRLTMAVLPKKQ
jgi:1,4-dihydroxy-2-naphthoyl-CoA hydrolase